MKFNCQKEYSYLSKFITSWSYLILVLILVFICVNCNLFYTKSQQYYFAFSFGSFLLFIAVCVHSFINKKVQLSLIPAIFLSWSGYIFLYAVSSPAYDDYLVSYLLCSVLYLASLSYLFHNKLIFFEKLYQIFCLGALFQCCVSIFQVFGVNQSESEYFNVIGTLNNPNITAMYIALSVPLYLNKIIKRKKVALNITFLIVSTIVLIILNCRSAYLGVLVILLTYFLFVYKEKFHLKNRTRAVKYTASIIGVILILLGSYLLYINKKNSADGRLLVWKISARMIREKPMGHGYTLFEKEYNMAQSEYFKSNSHANYVEKKNARHVNMAYNDFLEQAVQGGIAGGILFTSLILCGIYVAIQQKRIDIIAILIAGALMSSINFLVQAIPVWLLYLIALSKVVSEEKPLLEIPTGLTRFLSIICIIISISAFYKQIEKSMSQISLAKAINCIKMKNVSEAYTILQNTNPDTNSVFNHTYGLIFMKKKDFHNTIVQMELARKKTSSPDLYMDIAYCYIQTGNWKEAEKYLLVAKHMIPSYFRSRYLLMQLYTKSRQKTKLMEVAKEVLTMDYNNKNKDAISSRNYAQRILAND